MSPTPTTPATTTADTATSASGSVTPPTTRSRSERRGGARRRSDELPERFSVTHGELSVPGLSISFQRTLRVGDGDVNALPPGFGSFPLWPVRADDVRIPDAVRAVGGVLMPMHVFEAMWISFGASEPLAVQIGTGGICVLTGRDLRNRLLRRPQNYVVTTEQPWLDGYKTASGEVRQFVGVRAGSGLSVESQLAPGRSIGGIQIQVWRLTPEALERWRAEQARGFGRGMALFCALPMAATCDAIEIGAGGRIQQEVYRDTFAATDWCPEPAARVWVHPVPVSTWVAWTGQPAPSTPIDTRSYVAAGLPWFDWFDATNEALPATGELAGVTSVGEAIGGFDDPVVPVASSSVRSLLDDREIPVASGSWTWPPAP